MEDCTRRVAYYDKKVFGTINEYWATAVKVIQAREVFAEFLGTFMLVLIGDSAIAQSVTSKGYIDASEFLTINVGWGLGLIVALYISIGVTGGHLNPAVTFAMALRGKTSWLKVIPYWVAQFIGAFVAAAVVYGVYHDAIITFHNNPLNCNVTAPAYKTLCSAGIFATYPKEFLSLGNGFFDQVVGTFVLLMGIFGICDSNNSEPKAGLKPVAIGFVLLVVGVAFGFNCGYAVNPARDFSPRVFTAIAGWGRDVFICSQCSIRHWWWVPIVAPMFGAAAAAFIYWFFIEAHHNKPLGATYHRVSTEDDSEEEGLLAHTKTKQEEVN